MKKISLIMMTCICFLILIGCRTEENNNNYNFYYYYDYDNLKNTVSSVELIYYNNDNFKYDKESLELHSFDFSKMELLDVLSEKKLNTFYSELSKIKFYDNEFISFPHEECVKINYTDGSFDIIGIDYLGSFNYDSLGTIIKCLGDSYNYLVSNFRWFFDYPYYQEYE